LYGGGGVSALGAGLYGVLVAEAKLARKTIGPTLEEPPPDATGWYGRGRPGPAIRIALLGDSSAAGYGVERVEETPGAQLASDVSEATGRRVYLRTFCVVGARSSDLGAQVDRALPIEPDVAVILIGGNDVTNVVLPSHSVRDLSEGVRRLVAAGAKVVVGTCPDLGTVQPIAPPLKQMARAWSRRLAAAQTIATVEEGGRSVSLGDILGPEFAAAPALLFGPDQFHPSADGYRALVNVVTPSVLAALDEVPDEEVVLEAYRGEGVLPISRAAVQAVKRPGTELDGTEVGGRRAGVRGLWVELRHRRRRPQATAEAPESTEGGDPEPPSSGESDDVVPA
jgi:lysophospholipase L1-like esterase